MLKSPMKGLFVCYLTTLEAEFLLAVLALTAFFTSLQP